MALSTASFRVNPNLPYPCPCNTSFSTAPIRSHALNLHIPNYGDLPEKAFIQTSTSFLSRRGCKTTSKCPMRTVGNVRYYISSDEDNNLESTDFHDELEHFFGKFGFKPLNPLMKAPDHRAFKDKVTLIFDDGLSRFRLLLVISILLRVSLTPEVMKVVRLDEHVKTCLFNLLFCFSENDAMEMKKILEDRTTNEHYDHVKSVGKFLRKKCNGDPGLVTMFQIFHASCTSRDISNCAVVYLLKVAAGVVLKDMDDMIDELSALANKETSGRIPTEISHVEAQEEEQEEQVIKTLGENLTKYAKRLEARKDEIAWNLRIDEWLAIRKGEIIRNLTTTATFTSSLKKLMRSLRICRDTRLPLDDHDYIEYLDKFFRSIIHFNNILMDFIKDEIQNTSSSSDSFDCDIRLYLI